MEDVTKSNETDSKEKRIAKAKLWRMGNLEWKLLKKQKDIKDYLKNNPSDTSVVLCSRRFGKSYVLCCWAIEECIKTSRAVVKYACPTKEMVVKNINPSIESIIEDCPPDIKPEWFEANKVWKFPNGSQIQIASTEKGNAESLRGGYAQLCICDEAGFISDLTYVVNSIMAPTTDTTGGKIVLASTPNPKDPNHEFHTNFLIPLMNQEKLVKFTIYDSPFYTEKLLGRILDRYPMGEEDPAFKSEYLCEITTVGSAVVIPEFTEELRKDIIRESDVPPFYDSYVAGDPAVVDLTGILFAYYDFAKAKIVILDELVLGGEGFQEITTEDIASGVRRKEGLHFRHPITKQVMEPYLRVMDNSNKMLLNDLYYEHGLRFIATAKDNKEAQINKLRLMLRGGKIEIHPRCVNLIYHIKTAQWNKNHDGFQRVKPTTDNKLRGHHCDLVDALIYLVRNIDTSRSPYPEGYFEEQGLFHSEKSLAHKKSPVKDFMNNLMGIKPSNKGKF